MEMTNPMQQTHLSTGEHSTYHIHVQNYTAFGDTFIAAENAREPPVCPSCEARRNRLELKNEYTCAIASLLEESLRIDEAVNLARKMSMSDIDLSHTRHNSAKNAKECVRQIIISLQGKHGRDFEKELLAALEDIGRRDLKEEVETFRLSTFDGSKKRGATVAGKPSTSKSPRKKKKTA